MNPYKALQVDPSAEPEVIEGAYRRLAAKYHPDKNPSESAAARMKEINAAYDMLQDSARRARYDRQEAASVRLPPPTRPRLPWKYLSLSRKVVKVTAVVGIAVAVLYFLHEREKDQRNKKQLAELDLPALLGQELNDFTSDCIMKAGQKIPDLAAPYCSCLADVARTRFDMSPINVDSVEDYKRVVRTRFAAAVPGEVAQAACVDQVRSTTRSSPTAPKGTGSLGGATHGTD